MRLLVLGKGGREHALCWKLANENPDNQVLCFPGNPGIAKVATIPEGLDMADFAGLADFVERERVELTIVGAEDPLKAGIVNYFNLCRHPIVGPTKEAALVETSKGFAKDLMRSCGVPTASWLSFTNFVALRNYLKNVSVKPPYVLKYDGTAFGKGVEVIRSEQDLDAAVGRIATLKNSEGQPAAQTGRWLWEKYEEGVELSFFVLTDGEDALFAGSAWDVKPIYPGGPNTGGMGGGSPHPFLTDDLHQQIMDTIVRPMIKAMAQREIDGKSCKFRGWLYFQLMLTAKGPIVIEVNCRLGDPEAELILPRLDCELLDLLYATTLNGRLRGRAVRFKPKTLTIAKFLAAQGYPGEPAKGDLIDGISGAESKGALVFHAGTAWNKHGQLVTAGGRVVAVVGHGPDYYVAQNMADRAANIVFFNGKQWRSDIGVDALVSTQSV